MIKEGAIKAIDIPRMCANGVFLSDLINRLEGVFEKNNKFNFTFIFYLKKRDWSR